MKKLKLIYNYYVKPRGIEKNNTKYSFLRVINLLFLLNEKLKVMKLNTIYENNGQQCCKDLKKLQEQFTKLLISIGNSNMQTRNSFNSRHLNDNLQMKRNILKLKEFGYKPSAATSILKYYLKSKQNVPMNQQTINTTFTKKGKLRKV